MLNVKEALQKLLETCKPINEYTEVHILDSLGRILFEPIISQIDSPLFSNSSMDGFAVNALSLKNASTDNPIELKVVGDIPAGAQNNFVLQFGEALRIMTGAQIPENADVVVPVENTNVQERDPGAGLPDFIKISTKYKSGSYIRNQGEDFQVGTELLNSGHKLKPQDLGILAMLGISNVKVYRKPKIGLLSSGNELLKIGDELEDGKIRETNSFTISALLKELGCEVEFLGIAKDTEDDVVKLLDAAVNNEVDLIISSAGVIVGVYDYLRIVIEKYGYLDVWKINMRPGKPLMFGNYKSIPIIGLPGNPVSSFVGFEVFVRPYLNKMSGNHKWKRIALSAKLTEDIYSDGRESYLRAFLKPNVENQLEVHFNSHQGSGNLYSLSIANGLIIVPPGVKLLNKNQVVQAWLF